MPTTTNKNYSTPAHGAAVGTWDTDLNTIFANVDLGLGGTLTLQSSNGNVTLTSSQAYNLAYLVTGTLTANMTITFTSSLGGNGIYVVDNQSSGSFTVSVTQTSTGASPLTIPQGGRSLIYGNGTTFNFANSNQTAKLYSYLGSPQGNVAGTAATANGGATDTVRDVTNQITYATKTTGSSSAALWIPEAGLPVVGGMLTVSTDADNPVPSADVTGTASVFWTPFVNNWCWASDGTAIFPLQFSRMTLTLTNTNNAASQIQDVYLFWNSGSPVIGTGPTWASGGGSVTPGSCARGTGAGSAQISRVAGAWTNAVAMTINNGGNSYAMSAGQGILLGSLAIDGSAGQVSCYRSAGQSRKWAVSNAFPGARTLVDLVVQDPDATYSLSTSSIEALFGDSNNNSLAFNCLAEEVIEVEFIQSSQASASSDVKTGIGWNLTTAFVTGSVVARNGSANTAVAYYSAAPSLGLQRVYALDQLFAGAAATLLGQTGHGMFVRWRA